MIHDPRVARIDGSEAGHRGQAGLGDGDGAVVWLAGPGGRFVTGMSGEQFALPDAVERLREVRRTQPDGALITISAADPLNLTGIVTAGERIRTARRNRIVYRDGVPLAVREGDSVRELGAVDGAAAAGISRALTSRALVSAAR